MTEKKQFWVANLAGEKAFITGADELDRWGAHGWSETEEPTDRDFVWMTHPEVGQPAPIAWGARAYWQGIGFEPSPPAEPVDPTKDPVLTGVPAEPPAASAPVKTTSAASSAAKTKE